jgi:hypothetical protein
MGKRDKVDHHDHEAIVELIRVPTRAEADVLLAKLHANDIAAMAGYGDASGWLPYLGNSQGHSVMVFENDVERARELIT